MAKLAVFSGLLTTSLLFAGCNQSPDGDVVSPSGQGRVIQVDPVKGNDKATGAVSERVYRTISRALDDIPSVVDGGYEIHLAAGVHVGQVDLDRFVMPTGISRTSVTGGKMQSRFIYIHGDEAAPQGVIIRGDTHCINANGVFLMLRGVTLDGAKDAALFATASGVIVDDVMVTGSQGGGINLESSQAGLGGNIKLTGNSGIVLSFRNNTVARDATPWHAAVTIAVDGGGPSGVFLRDHSSLALEHATSGVSISNIRPTADRLQSGCVLAMQHSHAFGGHYNVKDCMVGFQTVQNAFINVDVVAERIPLLANAIKGSWLSLERPTILGGVDVLIDVDGPSWAAVGSDVKYGYKALLTPPPSAAAATPAP